MARVGARNTTPEVRVRKAAHKLGLRFRLHKKDLPGTPDLVFPKLHTAVFVHGCFWHRHNGCKKASHPKSRIDYWHAKFNRNIERDRKAVADLIALGWKVAVIWECQTKDAVELSHRIRNICNQIARKDMAPPEIMKKMEHEGRI
jgi:DNA mismatch endonuclease, patch repair protein